ncbi:MAG: PHB depolymerase family esterase [Crocinitomicaceae bacterium]
MNQIKKFGSNPGNLKMYNYLPKNADSTEQLPLVVVLHGCNQNAETIAEQSGWNELADKHHFVMLYPQQQRINNMSGCFNWFYKRDIFKEGGETQSVYQMIKYMIEHFPIDTSKIFIYGLSAGAAISVGVMVHYPELFKAGAIFAGAPYGIATNPVKATKVMLSAEDKTPEQWGDLVEIKKETQYPKILIFHGTNDHVVNIKNSYELIEQWTYIHNIDTIADDSIISFKENPAINRYSYTDNNLNELLVFYKILDGRHSLPVDPGDEPNQGGKTGLFSSDYDFFSTYYVAKEFQLIK